MIPNFNDLRALHQRRQDEIAVQRERTTRDAATTINLLTSIIQAPGYRVWREAILASAEGEHQKALTAKTPHEMAIALGAESAYRAAAHAAEDFIAQNQNTIEALKAPMLQGPRR
jgi:hypothetical protein